MHQICRCFGPCFGPVANPAVAQLQHYRQDCSHRLGGRGCAMIDANRTIDAR